MDDNTVKTGSGGATRRFLTRRNLLFAGIVAAVIIVAGGAGITLRMVQNRHAADTAAEEARRSLPKLINDVQDLRVQGDTAAANQKIDAALKDSATSKDDKYLLYIQKGAGLNDAKDYAAAVEVYSQAAALKQTSEVYDLLGDAYAAAGQKDKAIEAYNKAIPLVPASPVQDDDKEAIQNKIKLLEGGA